MGNKIQFLHNYILIEGTLIKIDQICVIKSNPNRFIGGTMILLSSGDEISFEKVSMFNFDILGEKLSYFIDFVRIQDFFINVRKVIAVSPIPEHHGYDGTFVYFEGAGKVDLSNVDTKLVLEKVVENSNK